MGQLRKSNILMMQNTKAGGAENRGMPEPTIKKQLPSLKKKQKTVFCRAKHGLSARYAAGWC